MSTVGLDERMVRAYIRNQDAGDARDEQMKMGVQVSRLGRLTVLWRL